MKKVFVGILFFAIGILHSQGELAKASTLIGVLDDEVVVKQNLHLNFSDTTKNFTLKMLVFEGNELRDLSIYSDGKSIPINGDEDDGLITIPIEWPSGNLSNILELVYTVEMETKDQYIPFFFTNLAATNSDDDFFTIELRMDKNMNYTLSFPNVKMTEKYTNEWKQINFQIPALTSMLRLEVHDGPKTDIALATWMDGLVALIFAVMGIVIWMNRKRLAYG
ncbi:MAG: hypothetical protein AAGA43_05415 [Bacteroidota bacterium]